MDNYDWLSAFIAESNRIEGITGVTDDDVKAHHDLLGLSTIKTPALEAFVSLVAPGHLLRVRVGQNVRVGRHIAPRGGPVIRERLDMLLGKLPAPFEAHLAYESLHPFTDGNGRSGRALWLWQMLRSPEAGRAKALGFLHTFYYQTLAAHRPTHTHTPLQHRER